MNKTEKQQLIDQLKVSFPAMTAIFVTDNRGLTVAEQSALRNELRSVGCEYRVIKNTLFRIASDGVPLAKLGEFLKGPSAFAICRADPVAAVKIVVRHSEKLEKLQIKGGALGRELLTRDDCIALAKLPDRNTLYAQLLGVLSAPASRLARTINGVGGSLVRVLASHRDKLPST